MTILEAKPLAGIYYGWVMVVLAAVTMTGTLPGRTYGLSLIKESVRTDVPMTDLQFNVLNFWAIILGSALVLPASWLIDRIGTRSVLSIVALLLGISVCWMAQTTDYWMLAVSLTLVRGLGQGALSVVAIAMVGKWFRRRAGLAMGVFTLLLGLGFVIPLMIVGDAVKTHGWRPAWSALGLALAFVLAPLGWLLARSSPESVGAEPDEDAESAGQVLPLLEAVRSSRFWVITACACLFNLTFSAMTLDSESLLAERGLDAKELNTSILGVMMIAGLAANIGAGLLTRRVSLDRLMAAGVAALAISLLLFTIVDSPSMAFLYAALLGVSGGMITVVYFAMYGHTYGRTHLGGIQGFVQVLTVFASAVGPVLLAVIREASGGSSGIFFTSFAVVSGALAVLALRLHSR